MSTDSHHSQQTPHLALWLDKLQDAVDGELASADATRLESHLAECDICRSEYQRLVKVDELMRGAMRASRSPSSEFDSNLLARIAAVEEDRRGQAKQRELLEFEQRLAQLRGGWRQLARFHLGNFLGGVATLGALMMSLVGVWANLGHEFRDSNLGSMLVREGVFDSPLVVLGVAVGFAAATILTIRRLDRRSR